MNYQLLTELDFKGINIEGPELEFLDLELYSQIESIKAYSK